MKAISLEKKEQAMTRQMSRAQRREACMQVAEEMLDRLEAWYDAHPDASFDEIEQQARQERRQFMGQVLEILVNGETPDFTFDRPAVGPRWSSRTTESGEHSESSEVGSALGA